MSRVATAAVAVVFAVFAAAGCGGGETSDAPAKPAASEQPAALDVAATLDQSQLGPLDTPAKFKVEPTTHALPLGDSYPIVYALEPTDTTALGKRLSARGFVTGGVHYYGTLPGTTSNYEPNGFESVMQFKDEDAARAEAGMQQQGATKPCPTECAL